MTFAAVDWTSITLAGAFIVGTALGTVATIRVFRYVLEYDRRMTPPDDPPEPPGGVAH